MNTATEIRHLHAEIANKQSILLVRESKDDSASRSESSHRSDVSILRAPDTHEPSIRTAMNPSHLAE